MLLGFKSHVVTAVTIDMYYKLLISITIGSVAKRQYDFQAWNAVFLICSWDSFLICGVGKRFVGRVGFFLLDQQILIWCV